MGRPNFVIMLLYLPCLSFWCQNEKRRCAEPEHVSHFPIFYLLEQYSAKCPSKATNLVWSGRGLKLLDQESASFCKAEREVGVCWCHPGLWGGPCSRSTQVYPLLIQPLLWKHSGENQPPSSSDLLERSKVFRPDASSGLCVRRRSNCWPGKLWEFFGACPGTGTGQSDKCCWRTEIAKLRLWK